MPGGKKAKFGMGVQGSVGMVGDAAFQLRIKTPTFLELMIHSGKIGKFKKFQKQKGSFSRN